MDVEGLFSLLMARATPQITLAPYGPDARKRARHLCRLLHWDVLEQGSGQRRGLLLTQQPTSPDAQQLDSAHAVLRQWREQLSGTGSLSLKRRGASRRTAGRASRGPATEETSRHVKADKPRFSPVVKTGPSERADNDDDSHNVRGGENASPGSSESSDKTSSSQGESDDSDDASSDDDSDDDDDTAALERLAHLTLTRTSPALHPSAALGPSPLSSATHEPSSTLGALSTNNSGGGEPGTAHRSRRSRDVCAPSPALLYTAPEAAFDASPAAIASVPANLLGSWEAHTTGFGSKMLNKMGFAGGSLGPGKNNTAAVSSQDFSGSDAASSGGTAASLAAGTGSLMQQPIELEVRPFRLGLGAS